VIKIKRKIVLHGPSTLTISLPSNWIKKFNVKKGDELNVEENGRELIINPESSISEKKEININALKRVGKSCITSAYRQGYDEIELVYENEHYIETIQDLISKEITGFEVIRQQSNHCIIRDLTGHNKDEFNAALRRIWLLLLDLSNESLNFIEKEEASELKSIRIIDYSINKFTNYCLRILIKKSSYNYKKTPLYYHIIKNLEEIGDKYKDLCIFHSNNPRKNKKELIELFKEINSHLNSVYELFYKDDAQKIEKLFQETKGVYNKLSLSNDRLAFTLASISRDIRSLLSLLVELNI